MSKSKHMAREAAPAAPRRSKGILLSQDGGLRTPWLLAVSLLAWAAMALALRYGLVRAFAALFEVWGVNADTAPLVPGWAQALYVWHGSLVTVIFAAAALMLCHWLRGLWHLDCAYPRIDWDRLAASALTGVGLSLLVAVVCLLPDSMRLMWPLTSPRFSWNAIVLLCIGLLSALAEEAFTKRVLYDGLSARWREPWPTLAACIVFFVIDRGYAAPWIGAVNVLLMGLMTVLIYRRRGLWASTGFRWGCSAANALLLGFGGGSASLYRLYGVSETALTGGDSGPACGLWTTLALAAVIAIHIVQKIKKQTE